MILSFIGLEVDSAVNVTANCGGQTSNSNFDPR